MRLLLINPFNPLVSLTQVDDNLWNQYRVWKPLGLLVLAGLTPSDWDIKIVDENTGKVDYASLPRPDLVGITAFTSQAQRAYEVADLFRARGIPVVMGGIHASSCVDEAQSRVDAVVAGEAEAVWPQLLEDAKRGEIKPLYTGSLVPLDQVPAARHDLLPTGYRFGSIQTTRGCPLNCNFCSVPDFNGKKYRHRPIEDVIAEFKTIKEKLVLVVDDNMVGTTKKHIERTKKLFRAMIEAKLNKHWAAQVTVNMADDEELVALAKQAGCFGVLIGFESPSVEGLNEVHKKFNIAKGRDFQDCMARMHRNGIMVIGSFIMGLDCDKPGIGKQISEAATSYGLDAINVLFLTPLPGTRLWTEMQDAGRIGANTFPEDWEHYTLIHPVATHNHLSWDQLIQEVTECFQDFYSYPKIARRVVRAAVRSRSPVGPLASLVANMSYRLNMKIDQDAYRKLDLSRGDSWQTKLARQPPVADPALAESLFIQEAATKAPAKRLRVL